MTVTIPGSTPRATSRTIQVVDKAGTPVAGTEVRIRQKRHGIGFGNIGFDMIPLANGETDLDPGNVYGGSGPQLAERLMDLFADVFNVATLPFYWRGFEPVEGQPDTQRLMTAARFFRDRGIAVKGHPLAWHTLAPQWLLGRSNADVAQAVRSRITRDVTDFAGLVDMWDAINEVVIMPVFTAEDNAITDLCASIGQVEMVRLAFDTARAANPKGTFLLNDFQTSQEYVDLIERCLEAGIQIDAIGVQSHMHQGYWGEEKTLEVLDRFAAFGLPIHMTETTLLSGHLMPPEIVDLNDYQIPSWPTTPEGEERQAEEIVRHYRTLVGHDSVEAITYWGITDAGSWLGAPCGLVRADGTPKPAYDALKQLITGDWWVAEHETTTNAVGECDLTCLEGDYEIEVGGHCYDVTVAKGDSRLTVMH